MTKKIQNFTFNLFHPNVFLRFTLFTFDLNPALICPQSTLSLVRANLKKRPRITLIFAPIKNGHKLKSDGTVFNPTEFFFLYTLNAPRLKSFI